MADLPIPLGLAVAKDVAVRPVRGALETVKEFGLELEIRLGGQRPGRVAGVNDGADRGVLFGEPDVVQGARVPDDQVAGVDANLLEVAAPGLEPLDVLLLEAEKVVLTGLVDVALGWREGLEELLKQHAGPFHEQETTVLWAGAPEVQQTLRAGEALALVRLVHMRPRCEVEVLLLGKSHIEGVKGDE